MSWLTVPKARPMVAGRPQPAQRRHVELGRVAGIAAPAIVREAHRQPRHRPVAQHLGDDRGGGDRQRPAVAADHALHGAGQRRRLVAVHQDQVGRRTAGGRPRGTSPAARRAGCSAVRSPRPMPRPRRSRRGPTRAAPGTPPAAARPSASSNRRAAPPAGAARRSGTRRQPPRPGPRVGHVPPRPRRRPGRRHASPAESSARALINRRRGVGPTVTRARRAVTSRWLTRLRTFGEPAR